MACDLAQWINPQYLKASGVFDIRESVRARPDIKYCVLDNFLLPDKLEKIIRHHQTLNFDEAADRTGSDMQVLPYDGAVKWASQDDFGAEFYFANEVKSYFCHLLSRLVPPNSGIEVKLRYHKPDANGFWIHSDSVWRSVVAILYFNHGWAAADGGLLQLWRPDEASWNKSTRIDGVKPTERLDMLTQHTRIRTDTPGGGWPATWSNESRDMILVDQVVPTYNRLFLCDLDANPTFHSVTPSNGKMRTGFVYWLNNQSHPAAKAARGK